MQLPGVSGGYAVRVTTRAVIELCLTECRTVDPRPIHSSRSENIDETPSGVLLHGIMASIAELYSRNLATEILKGSTNLIGRLSNPDFRERLAQLQEISGRAGRPGSINLPPRREHQIPVYGAIASVLSTRGGEPMRMYEIHEAVEQVLGRPVPRSTIKMSLATGQFERVSRGRYRLGPC